VTVWHHRYAPIARHGHPRQAYCTSLAVLPEPGRWHLHYTEVVLKGAGRGSIEFAVAIYAR
jgi:hypothetical protein